MLRRIWTKFLDTIENIVHFFDALADVPNPNNKFNTSSRPMQVPPRVRVPDSYR